MVESSIVLPFSGGPGKDRYFGGKTRDEFINALRAEGIPCSPGYQRPLTDEGGLRSAMDKHPHLIRRMPCPEVEAICATSVWFLQNMLLGTREDMDDILTAVSKIKTAFID